MLRATEMARVGQMLMLIWPLLFYPGILLLKSGSPRAHTYQELSVHQGLCFRPIFLFTAGFLEQKVQEAKEMQPTIRPFFQETLEQPMIQVIMFTM